MTLKALLEEVLLLQTAWQKNATPQMVRRGVIVRNEICSWLNEHAQDLRASAGWPEGDLAFEGSDGAGAKAEIPWTRLFSRTRSPGAQTGWYAVFLFSAQGDRCYLALAHGTTSWDGGQYRDRPSSELRALADWARATLAPEAIANGLTPQMQLDSRRWLGQSYELGTATAFSYDRNAIPDDSQLLDDLRRILSLLTTLYAKSDSDPLVPGTVPPEIAIATDAVLEATGKPPKAGGGQGFRLTPAEQRAVEKFAVKRVWEHLETVENWAVRSVESVASYDLHCKRGSSELFVEVKGTTSAGHTLLVTRNEVLLHQQKHPNNCLAVVSEIVLDRSTDPPNASGGNLELITPWLIDERDLEPIAYRYRRTHAGPKNG